MKTFEEEFEAEVRNLLKPYLRDGHLAGRKKT